MIDFIHPRSKVNRYGLVLSLVALVVVGFGSFVTFDKFTEYHLAKQIANSEALPSGDYLLKDSLGEHTVELEKLLEEVQDIQVETLNKNLAKDKTKKLDEEVIVAGIQYDENDNTNIEIIKPVTQVIKKEAVVKKSVQLEKIPNYNMIVIPRMGVKAIINEGTTADTLGKGIWRMPQGANPADGGNTVITAHRYLYRPPDPRTFFLIDKLIPGDTFYVYWKGKRYDYKVCESKIVSPNEVNILYNTSTNQITLFSCTPLFTSDNRLVVIADQI